MIRPRLHALIILAIMTVVALPSRASGLELERRLALESTLEAKLRTMLQSMDPSAFVRVTVTPRLERWNLPAAGVEAELPLAAPKSSYADGEIESVEATVYSRIEPVPEKLKELVTDSLTASLGTKVRRKVDFKSFDPQLAELINKRGKVDPLTGGPGFSNQENELSLVRNGLIALCGAMIIGALLIVLSIWLAFRNFGKPGVAASKTEDSGADGGFRNPAATSTASPDIGESARVSVRSEKELQGTLHETSAELVVRVMKDCRLARYPSYAKWIWQNLTLKQRSEVLRSWPESAEYVGKLRNVRAVADQFHEDPHYLMPANAQEALNCANDELATLLHSQPGIWMKLSPLRRQYSGLSLKDRIRLLERAGSKAEDFDLAIQQLAESDEDFLCENTEAFRFLEPALHPTWAWAFGLSDAELKQMLQPFSARQLAEAWTGSPKVMKRIESALSASKLERIKEFASRIEPRRASDTLREIAAVCAQKGSVCEKRAS